MTGNELYTLTQFYVDDSDFDEDRFKDVINIAMKRLASMRPWEFLKKTDDTNTATPSTTTVSLPSDFFSPLPIWVGEIEYLPIPKSERRKFRNSSHRFYVDLPNSNFVLTRAPASSDTVYIDYIMEPPEIDVDDTDISTTIPGFKKTFHPLLAYEAAKIFFYQDTGERSDSYAPEWRVEAKQLYDTMVEWDSSLKSAGYDSAMLDINIPSNNPNVIDEI